MGVYSSSVSPELDWNHDYPRADRHLAQIVADVSTARVHTSGSNVLDPDDPEIFRHPLVYLSEPGFWDMNDAEAQNLRQYLLKDGLILFDDFETTQWNNMAGTGLFSIDPTNEAYRIGVNT